MLFYYESAGHMLTSANLSYAVRAFRRRPCATANDSYFGTANEISCIAEYNIARSCTLHYYDNAHGRCDLSSEQLHGMAERWWRRRVCARAEPATKRK